MERAREKDIAIIGASSYQLPLIVQAKEMGYVTHVFAWEDGAAGEDAADYFYPISITERDKILNKCRDIGICGICSIASDLAMLTVNYVAEKLGLVGNSISATLKSTNKYYMRNAFEACGDPSPKSILADGNTDFSELELNFPVIVKPTDRSGSRGIYKVKSRESLETAIHSALDISFEKKILIEEYVEGEEYSVEYISYKGAHYFLALTQKYTTGAPNFIETGHKEPADVPDQILTRIKEVVEHALDSLELYNGASHSEIKIDANGEIKIIEIGGRMGGDCIGSHLVKYSTGYDFVRMVIQVACGEAPDFSLVCAPRPVECRFIFTYEDMEKLEKLKHDNPERIIDVLDIRPENIGHITDSSNRAGSYIYVLE